MTGPLLDRLVPRWDFRERHWAPVTLPDPALMVPAVEAVTWAEVPLLRALLVVRSLGRAAPPPGAPLFEDFLGTGPALGRAGDEIVYGWVMRVRGGGDRGSPLVEVPAERFAGFAEPGCVQVAANFRYGRGVLTTETRVRATDATARRAFRPYWLAVRLPGGLIRREWLRAVRRRALAAATPSGAVPPGRASHLEWRL